jgi:hypothetical protein
MSIKETVIALHISGKNPAVILKFIGSKSKNIAH